MTTALLEKPVIAGDERVTEGYRNIGDERIAAWIEQFHRDGYLFLENVLAPDLVEQLKADLDSAMQMPDQGYGLTMRLRLFETSRANRSLFDLEPLVTFAERMVDPNCHVMHNNSFITEPGGAGLSFWHQDDPAHLVVLEGEAPTNIHLPVLFFTCNYYLTDVTQVAHGATEVIPGSHLFGKPCPTNLEGTAWERDIVPCLGKAGSVVMFNNQVWHRGGPNHSQRTRYITQISYARRCIGHMYAPFMNYQMPEHVYADADPRLKRLLGFKNRGAYG